MIVQEYNDAGAHRLFNAETGNHTQWASYQQVTYLDGHVGYTGFFGGAQGGVTTPENFVRLIAVL